ncbi:MAG: NADH-quinone oxidoreductase subunit L [Bacteroidia bacterium]|nr:NADH-quinone oxidoreductase subunit L [Bacteroidia bacterium]MDW8088640.1 NADH-quinone oxidoreductase subunit L [Bacteroidia bacterium]
MVEQLLPLALALPALGALSIGIGGLWFPVLRRYKIFLGSLATALVGAAFAIFFSAFLTYTKPLYIGWPWDWIGIEELRIPLRYQIDTLSLWMALIVTGVGALIHLYSIGYMKEEPGFWRYFALLNLFIFAMLVLVLGDSLPLLFLGWEGVGACSYFLIGFWHQEEANARAAQKAFIMNRIGDLGLLAGMIWLYAETRTLDLDRLKEFTYPADVAIGVGILFFLAATGKSAQIPLYTWLPDAMAGPTPVSALIHAATMVTAGVYLIARMDFLYNSAPEVLLLVSGIGTATALIGALLALGTYDIKRILAYSTVSQLGFMFAAAGAGAYRAAIFHVFTHAFFKALLFLGSGSVIHSVGTQDIRVMGGLRRYLPWTGNTFWVGVLAIAGLPPLAGFFSKDEILAALYARGAEGETIYWIYWGTLLLVAFLTAFYMGRAAWLTFEGEYRGTATPHESPAVMTMPLGLLAIGAATAGLVNLPHFLGSPGLHSRWLASTLQEPASFHLAHTTEYFLLALSALIALVGLITAWLLYRTGLKGEAHLQQILGKLHLALQKQLYIDTLYEKSFVQLYYIFADLAKDVVGPWIGRTLPRALGEALGRLGALLTRLQRGYLPLYLAYFITLALLFLLWTFSS